MTKLNWDPQADVSKLLKPSGTPPPPLVPADSKATLVKVPKCPQKLPTGLPLNTALLSFYSSLFPTSLLSLLLNGFPAMLSTFPASLSSGSFLGNSFPSLEPGFPPWEYDDSSFLFHPLSPREQEPVVFSPQPSQEPVSPNSGSDTSNPTPDSGSSEPNRGKTKNLTSGSDEPDRNNSKNLSSGSDEPSRLGPIIDERKRRRMISNRESARRSRMRKQKHLENLRNQANRLKVGNRELMNRLRLLVHQNRLVQTENECLRSEAVILRQRLWDIRQVLLVRQLQQQLNPHSAWPCTNNERQLPLHSLIT